MSIELSFDDYHGFTINGKIKRRYGNRNDRIKLRAQLERTDEEMDRRREEIKEEYEELDVDEEALPKPLRIKEKIYVEKKVDQTFFGNTKVEETENVIWEARYKLKDKIDDYWNDQMIEERVEE